jgi:hypothetical protein
MNRFPGEFPLRQTEHAMCRLIRRQYAAIGICRNDRCRAALDQNAQLFFCFLACVALTLDFVQVLQRNLAAAIDLANEQTRPDESCKVEHIPRQSRSQAPRKIIEDFCQESAQCGDRGDLPGVQGAAHHQHGNQVKESKRNLADHPRVDKCYGDDHDCRPEKA